MASSGKKRVLLLKNEQLNGKPKRLKYLKSVILVKFVKISIEFPPFFSFLQNNKANMQTKKTITPLFLATKKARSPIMNLLKA